MEDDIEETQNEVEGRGETGRLNGYKKKQSSSEKRIRFPSCQMYQIYECCHLLGYYAAACLATWYRVSCWADFVPEYKGDTFLRNVGSHANYTTLNPIHNYRCQNLKSYMSDIWSEFKALSTYFTSYLLVWLRSAPVSNYECLSKLGHQLSLWSWQLIWISLERRGSILLFTQPEILGKLSFTPSLQLLQNRALSINQ
jgi:hypothetical protein